MFGFDNIGKALVVTGLLIAVIGGALLLLGKISWLGRLPGDFHYEGKGFSFYFPLTTSVLISIILSLIFWLINRR